ncbi:MAG: type II toxin-antitoxin system HicA family toxin [Chloroflexi bacterium]|nr:type II toxin-antitoxin system HicA family toxin [Chloroflexota bacterium]
MSKRLPAAKPRQVVRALEKAGWYVHRQKGSHVIMHKPGSHNLVVIPMHTSDMPKGTLNSILDDAGLSVDEFTELLS